MAILLQLNPLFCLHYTCSWIDLSNWGITQNLVEMSHCKSINNPRYLFLSLLPSLLSSYPLLPFSISLTWNPPKSLVIPSVSPTASFFPLLFSSTNFIYMSFLDDPIQPHGINGSHILRTYIFFYPDLLLTFCTYQLLTKNIYFYVK